MKVIETKLINLIKDVTGDVILIGISFNSFLKAAKENKEISKLHLLKSIEFGDEENKSFFEKIDLPLNKIKKKYKKNKIDYIFIDYNHIKNYLKSFIKDSIYINNKKIYIVFDNEDDLIKVSNKYKMFNSEVTYSKEGKSYLLRIDNTNVKSNKIKDKIVELKEVLNYLLDLLEKHTLK